MERDADHPSMIDKDGSRIKRPMNAFMIWAKEMRKKILSDSGGTLQNSEVSRILGMSSISLNFSILENRLTSGDLGQFLPYVSSIYVLFFSYIDFWPTSVIWFFNISMVNIDIKLHRHI